MLGSIVKNKIATNRMCILVDACDLNRETFKPSLEFHVNPKFGPPGGFLMRLLQYTILVLYV